MTAAEPLIFRVRIDASAEAVWHELTRTDQPQAAGYNCLLLVEELTAGRAFQMRSPTGRIVNVVGTIDECEPPRRLKQTMKYPQLDEEFTSLWEIDDAPDGGVEVTLTVEGLPPEGKTAGYYTGSGGGSWICKTLKQVVENGRASFGTRVMYRISNVIERFRQPDGTEPERWPFPGAN